MGKTVIHGELAEYYDRVHLHKDYPKEARDLLRLAARTIGRRPLSLLDVGCGTGVHLAEFRKKLSVAGVDRSPDMLRIARRRLGTRVPLVRGDMRRFSLKSRFDIVTCLFSAIGYMETRQDRDRAITNFYRHLNPGGVALVEGWVLPERWRGTAVNLQTYKDTKAGIAQAASTWREGNHSVVEFQWLIAERGKQIRHFSEIWRSPLVASEEMMASFRRAGFRVRLMVSGRYRDRGLYVGIRPALT